MCGYKDKIIQLFKSRDKVNIDLEFLWLIGESFFKKFKLDLILDIDVRTGNYKIGYI